MSVLFFFRHFICDVGNYLQSNFQIFDHIVYFLDTPHSFLLFCGDQVRIASASTVVVMLDGPSSVFLQVAEYKESTKWGSFMALSSSLGRILMQLHTGSREAVCHAV
jgi:hypothetical protein